MSKTIAFANEGVFVTSHRQEDLKRLGFNVIFCHTASDVLKLFDHPPNTRPDMLITDSLLTHAAEFTESETWGGVETGRVLYQRIRESNPHLPVIIYTSDSFVFERLLEISDPYLVVVSETADSNPTNKIMEAVKRMLQ